MKKRQLPRKRPAERNNKRSIILHAEVVKLVDTLS